MLFVLSILMQYFNGTLSLAYQLKELTKIYLIIIAI